MISLRNRLILTYSVFISIALFILTAGINIFAGMIFDKFIMDTIEERSGEIVRTVGELYNPIEKNFDRDTLEAVGMLFVHDGYIIDVEDAGMVTLWNARDMNMGHCVEVLNEINNRMKTRYGVNSELQNRSFPIKYHGANVGVVNIATVGPIFYSETQGQFLTSLNRLLIAAALFFIIISVGISVILAFSIAEPVKAASGAARKIASFYKLGGGKELYSTSLIEDYKTHELSELSKSINSLARELAESERRQKQLTSDIAHELRTPLTGLQGTIEAMIDGVWEAEPQRLKSCLEEVKRLSKLIEDMRVLTGLEWEKITLHKTNFDMRELLECAGEQFIPAAKEKGIDLRLETRMPDTTIAAKTIVNADYDRIKQVIINLISNAVKYTDTGHITISISDGGEGAAVKIEDTGVGIAKEDLPHIFDRFYRADKSRNSLTGGSGIGLTIASSIATAHGWALSAESEVGRGTVFTLLIR